MVMSRSRPADGGIRAHHHRPIRHRSNRRSDI